MYRVSATVSTRNETFRYFISNKTTNNSKRVCEGDFDASVLIRYLSLREKIDWIHGCQCSGDEKFRRWPDLENSAELNYQNWDFYIFVYKTQFYLAAKYYNLEVLKIYSFYLLLRDTEKVRMFFSPVNGPGESWRAVKIRPMIWDFSRDKSLCEIFMGRLTESEIGFRVS